MKRKFKGNNMPRVIGKVHAKDSESARSIATRTYPEYVVDAVYLETPSSRGFKGMKTWTVDGHTRQR